LIGSFCNSASEITSGRTGSTGNAIPRLSLNRNSIGIHTCLHGAAYSADITTAGGLCQLPQLRSFKYVRSRLATYMVFLCER
jgi:hypothetical protein